MRVEFDITQSLLELSELEISVPDRSGNSLISTTVIDERRKILQRGLNLEDAASSLLSYLRANGRTLRGDKASITSDEELSITTDEVDSAIDDVSELSEITTGSFTINGVDIQIDTSTDSLSSIIDKINDADAGVKASFDYADGELTIQSLRNKQMLLEDGSSNFFTATNLKEGYIAGEVGINIRTFLESDSLQQRFSRFTGRFNRLMAVNFKVAGLSSFETKVQELFGSAIQTHFNSEYTYGATRLGSNVEFFMNSDQTRFTKTKIGFTSDDTPYSFFDFLESTDGILGALSALSGNESDRLIQNINSRTSTGLIIQKKI